VRILYLVTRELDGTGAALARELAREHEVEVIDLAGRLDFGAVVDRIAAADRVICW
jgi:hypothetical protein